MIRSVMEQMRFSVVSPMSSYRLDAFGPLRSDRKYSTDQTFNQMAVCMKHPKVD